jgi:hypothetical protein
MPTILTASWSARLPGGTTAVGISRGTPRGRGGFRRLPALFPGPWFRSVAPETYLRRYAEILAPLGPRRGVACSWREVAADNANYRSQRRDQAPDRSETRHPPPAEPPADELALALNSPAPKSPRPRVALIARISAHSRSGPRRAKLAALPATPAVLAAFLACEAKRGARPSSISRRIAGIRYAHLLAGHEPPSQAEMVKATFRGIRRSVGSAPKRKQPLTADSLRAHLDASFGVHAIPHQCCTTGQNEG